MGYHWRSWFSRVKSHKKFSKNQFSPEKLFSLFFFLTFQESLEEDSIPYERVELREIQANRPIVLYGPVAKYMQSQLTSQYPNIFKNFERKDKMR